MHRRNLHIVDLEALTSDIIKLGGTLSFRVHGHCMRPAVQDGDQVSLGPAGSEGWRLGDVVLARGEAGLCLHRIMAMGSALGGPWVQLAADADPSSREKLPARRVLAKLISLRHQKPSATVGLKQLCRWAIPPVGCVSTVGPAS